MCSFIQVNYLIDEAANTGKGANAIISMLHHFFSTHGLGETTLHLHADNCSGQNKNKFVMQYLVWRVLARLNKDIELSFMVAGHTKFSPDWCFGLFKRAFRRAKVGCLDDIVRVVESSAVVNHAQLVATQEGKVLVPTFDWASYLQPLFITNPFIGIKALPHFYFSAAKPGSVIVRVSPDSTPQELRVVRDEDWQPSADELPPIIHPPGLSFERKKYLYEKIREFCPEECQDIVCPEPTVSLPPPSKRQKSS